ncbi:uncharacterized protein F4807DRAFT_445989 [Annulohypoxylon truncatum]|uniref:uncharacterized protein n=1 Tax=Annulohypoxylon truncatum TaxID=327061 RepID=UPI002007732F|nr:uncharacterized protein F4807DRAFT_445989 [Annulohypoxylon truncatum]KAI1204723.1 hypothetical protein F4807DRAFT_445989 [Annulohypoxylon truncatum]
MADSDVTVYHGATPHKPQHFFSRNPPTPHPTNEQSLRSYRLNKFVNGPDNVSMAHVQTIQPHTASSGVTGSQAGTS